MAFDPENPTFYGASLQVDAARVIAGVERHTGPGDEGDALRYLYNDNDFAWFEPDDRALVGFYPERGLLTLDDEVVFSVVVELRQDSTGSVRLSAGVDPTWDLLDASHATEPLGVFDASGTFTTGGRSQIIIPVTAWSGAMVYGGDVLPIVHLEALSGQPRILQVRVRMWPPDGVGGAWENDPDYDVLDLAPRAVRSDGSADMLDELTPDQTLGSGGPVNHAPGPGLWGGFDDTGDTEAAFESMAAHMFAHGIPPYRAFTSGGNNDVGTDLTGTYTFWWTLHQIGDPSRDWSGQYTSSLVFLVADAAIATARSNGYTYPDPDRVPGEWAAAVRDGFTGGTLRSVFQEWTAFPEVAPALTANDRLVSIATYGLAQEPAWVATDIDFSTGTRRVFYLVTRGFEAAPITQQAPAGGTLDIPGTPVVAIEANGSQPGTSSMLQYEFESDVGVADVAHGSRSVDYGQVRSRQRFQGVQWYNPGAAAPTPKPRFYVKHHDDTMRPVGFGKPATELTMFRVPGRGRWRDLTTAEYATYGPGNRPSGGMPLKVKRQDGSGAIWWDHVGWLVPDLE